MKRLYLSKTDPQTLEELKQAGFHVCVCCTFKETYMLHYFNREGKHEVHSNGFGCEEDCKEKCLEKCSMCHIQGALESGNVVIFNNVSDFIEECLKMG